MKIQPYQKDKLCCHITNEDLKTRNIKVNDFAKGTEAAKRLFYEIMEQAAPYYNFNANDTPLKIEAIPIDADHITLIISKEQESKIINFQEWKKKNTNE